MKCVQSWDLWTESFCREEEAVRLLRDSVFILDHTVIHSLRRGLGNLSKWYALFLKYDVIFLKILHDFPLH